MCLGTTYENPEVVKMASRKQDSQCTCQAQKPTGRSHLGCQMIFGRSWRRVEPAPTGQKSQRKMFQSQKIQNWKWTRMTTPLNNNEVGQQYVPCVERLRTQKMDIYGGQYKPSSDLKSWNRPRKLSRD
eukprot:Lithocolla_globosa_v1_NODE_309_length_4559_cov_14.810169.p6 type:complete len:128 gc:universal NODE_309_length_4559_cov_14.810169:1619-2002(+)